MSMTLSTVCSPSTALQFSSLEKYLFWASWAFFKSVLNTKVDLPLPETPVTQTNLPNGISTSMSFRLFPQAPINLMPVPLPGRRTLSALIDFAPLKYWPVNDCLFAAIICGVPQATTSPPCTPAPSPMSKTKSASRIASSSCSTTITELPWSRKFLSVSSNRLLSR